MKTNRRLLCITFKKLHLFLSKFVQVEQGLQYIFQNSMNYNLVWNSISPILMACAFPSDIYCSSRLVSRHFSVEMPINQLASFDPVMMMMMMAWSVWLSFDIYSQGKIFISKGEKKYLLIFADLQNVAQLDFIFCCPFRSKQRNRVYLRGRQNSLVASALLTQLS